MLRVCGVRGCAECEGAQQSAKVRRVFRKFSQIFPHSCEVDRPTPGTTIPGSRVITWTRFLCRTDPLEHNMYQSPRVMIATEILFPSKLGLCQFQPQHREMISSECRPFRTIMRELLYFFQNSQTNENRARLTSKKISLL